jgi:hypothetical protein
VEFPTNVLPASCRKIIILFSKKSELPAGRAAARSQGNRFERRGAKDAEERGEEIPAVRGMIVRGIKLERRI